MFFISSFLRLFLRLGVYLLSGTLYKSFLGDHLGNVPTGDLDICVPFQLDCIG